MSTPVAIDLVANDVDPGGTAVVTGVTQGTHGRVVLAGTRATYTPAPGWKGSDRFRYTISNSSGSSSATVTVTVKPVTPTCTVTIAGVDSAVIGVPLQLTAQPRCNVGTPEVQWWYRSAGHEARVFQSYGTQLTAVFDTSHAAPGELTVFARVRSRGTATAVSSNPLGVTIIDDDVAPCTAVVINNPVNGAAVVRGNGVALQAVATCPAGVTPEYQLWARRMGTDAWTLQRGYGPGAGSVVLSSAGAGDWEVSATARSTGSHVPFQVRSQAVQVSVGGALHANDDALTIDEDHSGTVNVLHNDSNPSFDPVTVTITTAPAGGIAAVSSDGANVVYTPARNYNGSDSFGYTVTSNRGASSSATVHVTIDPINDRPVAIDDSLVVTADSSGSFDLVNNDTDVDGDTLRVISIEQPDDGTVTFSGNLVTYTPDAGFTGSDYFDYTIDDGHGGQATGMVSVAVVAAGGPVAVDDQLTTAEDTRGSVNVLSNDRDPSGRGLTVVAFSQPGHGSVTFTGGVASYEPAHDYNGPDAFGYTARSASGATTSATVHVVVTAVNDAPVAANDSVILDEDTSVTVDVVANDSDVDGDALAVVSITQPAHGSAAIISARQVRYTPGPSFNGSDAFSYTVADPRTATATATVSLTVAAINDPPVAVADTATAAEDTSVTIDVVANDSDPDGDALTITSVAAPAHGTVTILDASHVGYTPAADYTGPDTFSYTISDGRGGEASATVTLAVGGVNDAPHAVDNLAVLDEDTEVTVDVVANDTDPDGDPLSVVAVTQPAHGIAQIVDGHRVTYAPAANFNGDDSFRYTIDDGSGGQATATVVVTVAAVNDAPVAVADTASLAQGTSVTIDVLANDSDVEGDPLTIVEFTQAANGTTASIASADGTRLTYTPAPGFSGTDSFSYSITDPAGSGATATVTIEVDHVNAAPIANADTATVPEDGGIAVDVVGNDTDADGDALAIISITQPAHGAALVIDGHRIAYAPAADFHGTDSLSYTISDTNGDDATATLTIEVASVNDAPIARGDATSTLEDTAVAIDVVANDSDIDGDALAILAVAAPAHGAAAAIDGQHIAYTPAPNFHGADSFSYTVADPSGATATAVVAIEVISVNDAPLALADAAIVNEDTAVTVDVVANDLDIDGDALAITAITAPAHGIALLTDAHRITYIPAPNFHGSDALSYTISDGAGGLATAELAIEVQSVNDAPVAAGDAASLDEDGTVVVDVVANDSDIDGDALAIASLAQPAHGAATLVDGHRVQYTPAANFHGSDAVGYTISDGHGGQATATLALTVISVNDAPVAVGDAASLLEDTAVTVDVVANDADVDGDALAIASITPPAHGSAAIVNSHSVSYTPALNFHGTDAVQYTIADGNGGHATATLTLDVQSVNDAPVASDVAVSTFDDTPVTVALAVSDVDGDPLTVAIGGGPAHGTLGAVAGNQVVYTPAAGFVGTDSFTYSASDGQASSAAATVAITVIRSVCGNGVREGVHEECDDGNAAGGDGCEPSCKLTCGSGTGADRSTVDATSGHCFAAYDRAPHGYQDAAALCAGVGGHLPTITSADEDVAAFAAVRAGDRPWLGGDDIAVEGTFTWTTGETFGYTNFASTRPDPASADCLQYTGDGTWSDASCASTGGTLCEVDLATATPAFATGGTGPHGVAVGDLNKDGFADLATVNQTSNTVGILRGNGAGGFVLQATYATGAGTGPTAIASGDLDGDGNVDLAVVNTGTNAIGILRGQASGDFVAGATIGIAAGATSIVAGDFDGDHVIDLAVAATGTVQVLRGNGSGGFTLLTSIGFAGVPASIAAGDFNRDDALDLAIATPLAVVVVPGSGGGLFGPPVSLTLITSNRSITTADVDGDHNLDLVVANNTTNLTVLFGSATGTFSVSTTLTLAGTPQLVATGDFDGDGVTDVAGLTANHATLFHGAGRTFTPLGAPIATGGGGASFAVAARVNADAATDLVVVNQTTATAGLLLGSPAGFTGGRVLVGSTAANATVSGDFNEDGRADLAVVDTAANRVLIYLQNTGGALVQSSTITTPTAGNSMFLAVGQFNVDQHLDLAIVNTAFNSVGVATGIGNGNFNAPVNASTQTSPRRLAVGNFDNLNNNDQDIDIAVAAAGANFVSILLNNGAARFSRVDVPITGTPVDVAVGDFDHDGNLDFAAATSAEASVKLVFGNGNTTFVAPIVLPIQSGSQSIAAADLDGDGLLDLIATNTTAGSVSILHNLGGRQFAAAISVPVGPQPSQVVAVDLDGDTRIDLVVSSQGSNDVTVLHASPAGGFVPTRFGFGVSPLQLTVADLDHDGHLDITAASGSPFVTTLMSPR